MKKFAFVLAALLSGQAFADDATTARYACMMRLKKSMHDPAAARFDEWQRGYAKRNDRTGLWRVQIEFHARNGFNALRRGVGECGVSVGKDGNAKVLTAQQIQ